MKTVDGMRYYITNMSAEYRPIAEEAISVSKRSDIHVDDEPIPIGVTRGSHYEGYLQANRNSFSIYVDSNVDCSDFWDCFDRLKRSDRWKTWLFVSGHEGY